MMSNLTTALVSGVRVLEVSGGPSGSYAGRLLAGSGAAVTKLMQRSGRFSLFRDKEKKLIYANNEQEMTEMALRLLDRQWDIIVWNNYSNRSLDQLLANKAGKKHVSTVFVRLNFPDGVNAEEELGLQSIGGWMALTGDPEQPPLAVGGEPACCLVGTHAAAAAMLALIEKRWTAQGRLIQVNALTVVASALEGAVSAYLSSGQLRGRAGNRHHSLTPMAILPAADGLIFSGAPVDEQWALLEAWAGLPHKEDWAAAEERRTNCFSLEGALAGWTKQLSRKELFLTGQTFRLPFANVQSLQELRQCPQLAARKFWTVSESTQPAVGLPWKINLKETEVLNGRRTIRPDSWQKIRVLDLTSMWSGPYCTRIFADMGAEVIKVEAPHRPDGIRANQDASAPFFSELNRNKLGIQLDLRLDKDRNKLLELVKTSDVLVENFSPRVMANFGLHPEELWKHRSDLIILSLSAFGQTGPYRDFVGYGPTLEAMSGIAALTHYWDRKPWLPGFSVSDIGAGIHGAFAAAASLHLQQQEGRGVRIDLSQYEAACQFIGSYLTEGTMPANPEKAAAARSLADVAQDPRLPVIRLSNGSSVLGTPWESPGWITPMRPPPLLGEHTDKVCRGLAKR